MGPVFQRPGASALSVMLENVMKKLLLVVFAWICFMSASFASAPVDLNTADQARLETVKGIGPVKSRAIIEYRTRNGPFKSVDELKNVTGFGKISVDKLRAEVAVEKSKSTAAKATGSLTGGAKSGSGKSAK